MTALQDRAVSLSFQGEANLLSLRLRTRCSTNYSDSDINENPHVYFQHTNQRLASICLIWSLIKMCFMNSKCELAHNKEAPHENKARLLGKTNLVNSFSASNAVKDEVTGGRKCHEYQARNILNHTCPGTGLTSELRALGQHGQEQLLFQINFINFARARLDFK